MRFCHEAERAFRPDEEPRHIVPAAGFPRSTARLDHRPVCQHDFETQHPVLHRPVAVGVGAATALRDHAAYLCAGAGVWGEEGAVRFQEEVEILVADAGLDGDVHVVFPEFEDVVHMSAEVDAHFAVLRRQRAFETGASAEAYHGDATAVADFGDVADVLGGFGEDDHAGDVVGIGCWRPFCT